MLRFQVLSESQSLPPAIPRTERAAPGRTSILDEGFHCKSLEGCYPGRNEGSRTESLRSPLGAPHRTLSRFAPQDDRFGKALNRSLGRKGNAPRASKIPCVAGREGARQLMIEANSSHPKAAGPGPATL